MWYNELMKKVTNKHIKKLGVGLFSLALLGGGIASFINPTWAATQTGTAKVQFTFNSTLTMTGQQDLAISGLTPGTAGESSEITITVTTNNAAGFTLTGTSGTSTTSTDLTSSGKTTKFTHLSTDAALANKEAIGDNSWGIQFATGGAAASTGTYTGFPKDAANNGTSGKSLLSTTAPSNGTNNVVKLRVGAKASTAMQAGTYSNVINLYATAK